jgi:two-component system cell cycle response regulator DivK
MTAYRVLVVEDEEDNMNLFVQLLTFHSCQVFTARDGREAITIAQREVPDLILMDLSLPALDGWEATRAIKGIPELVHVPIVALTAHAMVGDRERALAAGCDGYITKPIDVMSFFDRMRAYLPDEPGPAEEGGA